MDPENLRWLIGGMCVAFIGLLAFVWREVMYRIESLHRAIRNSDRRISRLELQAGLPSPVDHQLDD